MSDFSKTLRYLKRNGIKNTYYAVMERLSQRGVPYEYADIDEDEEFLERIKYRAIKPVLYSILVPVYETKEEYLRAMIDSCLAQTYDNFELILADASVSDKPRSIIEQYEDDRVKYVRVVENKGISENTNVALSVATGHYCVLLDHDDLLTKNALFEVTEAIMEAKSHGVSAKFIYSDEDKCDGTATKFFDPHYKRDIDVDLLMANNYICHLSVIETAIIKRLKFRGEFNGSQDHDLFLRVIGHVLFPDKKADYTNKDKIIHINKVLYHWRCHDESTAANPASKEYAYKAGKAAVRAFVKTYYGDVKVFESKHKGFYDVKWGKNIFDLRPEVGAVGGPLTGPVKIIHGIYNEDGTEEFAGLNKHYSGYMQRASLVQEAYALDIRTVTPAPEFQAVYDELIDLCDNAEEDEIRLISLNFAKHVHKGGKIMIYEPNLRKY